MTGIRCNICGRPDVKVGDTCEHKNCPWNRELVGRPK